MKRLRHTARVTVAPCYLCGRVQGPAVGGLPEFVPPRDQPQALAALRRAYGLKFTIGNTVSRLWHRVLRRDGERHEILGIRPACGGTPCSSALARSQPRGAGRRISRRASCSVTDRTSVVSALR